MSKRTSTLICLIICISFSLKAQKRKVSGQNDEGRLFELLNSKKSGIDFSNDLQHDIAGKANLFDFDYFYNGAGVGIADLNNDGLEDIFFCGNQVENKLYLNKGRLKFKDISNTANVNSKKKWSNGVTFADVNNDGWLDIYVSQGGPFESENRENLLFINNQDLTFTESAQQYGLNDKGLSTQSVFFDFDHDGDLDCLVMNENEFYGLDPIKFHQILLTNKDRLWENSSHLYEQEAGQFRDVTEKAGLLRPSFGLGLVVSDINLDGWEDIYMANDYYVPDALFINRQDGTFKDEVKEMTSQLSFFGMGADIADLNNDLLPEIFVLDMASADHIRSKTLMASMDVDNFDLLTKSLEFQHQYMFNSLQLNMGNDKFRNAAHFSGVAKTDWSWTVLLSDFNNDTKKDIFISNGYRRYALDNDFKNQVFEAQIEHKGQVPLEIKKALYEKMPSEKLSNLLFLNRGDLHFDEAAAAMGMGQPTFSNGSAVADLDLDGDLDLVVNNIDQEAFVYKNLTSERKKKFNYLDVKAVGALSESFAKVTIYCGELKQTLESKRVRGYFSSVSDVCHFGLGNSKLVDSVIVNWPDGSFNKSYNVAANQTITVRHDKAKISHKNDVRADNLLTALPPDTLNLDFKHQENFINDFDKEVLLPYKQSTLGPFLSKGDVNNDGKMDIYIGGARGQAGQIYLNEGVSFSKIYVPDFEIDKEHEDMESIFVDIDNDGDLDLYVVSGGNSAPPNATLYQDRIYVNENGNFYRSRKLLPDPMKYSGRSVAAIDFDNDSDYDLIVGNRLVPQNYPVPGENQILENRDGIFYDITSAASEEFKEFGLVNKVISTDFDRDGLQDFIAVGEWTGIGLFRNTGNDFINIAQVSQLDSLLGLWFEVHETDFNKDGLPDYILGNVGNNTKFKASKEKPFRLFANDFDSNGSIDIVLSKEYKGEYVPVRGRECSSQQMPFIAEKFKTYEDFANASVYDIFEGELNASLKLEVNTLSSIVLINQGAGKFKTAKLPTQAQLFPLLECQELDLDKDGRPEFLMAGNIYNTEVETPRWDAGMGIVISYDDVNSKFEFVQNLTLEGNIKDIDTITMEDGVRYLLSLINNELLGVYKINDSKMMQENK